MVEEHMENIPQYKGIKERIRAECRGDWYTWKYHGRIFVKTKSYSYMNTEEKK